MRGARVRVADRRTCRGSAGGVSGTPPATSAGMGWGLGWAKAALSSFKSPASPPSAGAAPPSLEEPETPALPASPRVTTPVADSSDVLETTVKAVNSDLSRAASSLATQQDTPAAAAASDDTGPFRSSGCFLAGCACLSVCKTCEEESGHQCPVAPGKLGSDSVCDDTAASRLHILNEARVAKLLSIRWPRSWGRKPRSVPQKLQLVDRKLRVCGHAVRLLCDVEAEDKTKKEASPSSGVTVGSASGSACASTSASADEPPARCEVCSKTASSLAKKKGGLWKDTHLPLQWDAIHGWVCNLNKCKDQRRRQHTRTTEADATHATGVHKRKMKPLTSDLNGVRRIKKVARSYAKSIKAIVEDADDDTVVPQLLGEALEKELPGLWPQAQQRRDAHELMRGMVAVVHDRGAGPKGGAPKKQKRDIAFGVAKLIGGGTVPVRRTAALLVQLSGAPSDADTRSLRSLLTQGNEARANDPQLEEGMAAPARARDPNSFRNNVAAVQLVLTVWVENAALTGMYADANRNPPHCRPQRSGRRRWQINEAGSQAIRLSISSSAQTVCSTRRTLSIGRESS